MNNLKKIRLSQNLTMMELSEKLGISIRLYMNYEHDKNLPNVRRAIKIAQALNSTVEECFAEVEEINNESTITE